MPYTVTLPNGRSLELLTAASLRAWAMGSPLIGESDADFLVSMHDVAVAAAENLDILTGPPHDPDDGEPMSVDNVVPFRRAA